VTGQDVAAGALPGAIGGFALGSGVIANAAVGAAAGVVGHLVDKGGCATLGSAGKTTAYGALGGVAGRQLGLANGLAAARAGATGSALGHSTATLSGFYAQSVGGGFVGGAMSAWGP